MQEELHLLITPHSPHSPHSSSPIAEREEEKLTRKFVQAMQMIFGPKEDIPGE